MPVGSGPARSGGPRISAPGWHVRCWSYGRATPGSALPCGHRESCDVELTGAQREPQRATDPPLTVMEEGILNATDSRVVLVDVDVVQRALLQAEHVDHLPMEDVTGLSEELVEAPALLLVRLQDVGQNRGEKALQAPE